MALHDRIARQVGSNDGRADSTAAEVYAAYAGSPTFPIASRDPVQTRSLSAPVSEIFSCVLEDDCADRRA